MKRYIILEMDLRDSTVRITYGWCSYERLSMAIWPDKHLGLLRPEVKNILFHLSVKTGSRIIFRIYKTRKL